MPRVKRGMAAHRRHKKIFKQAKGFRGKRKNVFKLAKNAVMKAGQNAYRGRKLKKRTFHQLWVLRINNACREHGLKYSRFIYGLELAGIEINRKMLSELAISEPDVFKEIVEKAKAALPPEGQAPDIGKPKKAEPKAEKKTAKKPKAEKPVEDSESAESASDDTAEPSDDAVETEHTPSPEEETKE
ncbi:50S ribosomal protein L20 [Patescibacteria group bacterium]|nr:50S ribosomal protein L20 [Patescibacteria group bacterium]